MKRRVVVTGYGVISPLGADRREFADALASGRSAIRLLDFDDHAGERRGGAWVGAPVARCAPTLARRMDVDLTDRVSRHALVAGCEAVEQSGLCAEPGLAVQAGVYVGTSMGGAQSIERAYGDMFLRESEPRPFSILSAMNNAAAGHLSMRFGLKGPNVTFSSACASSTIAIGEAFHAIRGGLLDCAMAGGTEACLVPGVLRAWSAMRVLARPDDRDPAASCRPFSRDRRGIVLGEGAAIFVLERLETALHRRAPILGEILGYGMSADATHITNPNVEGQSRAMSNALTDAGLDPCDIDYVNAHGTATHAGDISESAAIKRVFGAAARRIAVSSTKSVHGHLLGAAGAVELAACLCAQRGGFLPATMHLAEADPECDLDYVANAPRHGAAIHRFMSNSFAFGGSNAVLIGGAFRD
ncbi:MAG TPA: beta-ketoacyl-[acyl-carrier-protein] synthase family protein [Steroidobacteraceae bacterium]|nr:beta-ketoacyl-[acyl-carrier-protein] synthase family protein [Steroidobacteraceae bacterium]